VLANITSAAAFSRGGHAATNSLRSRLRKKISVSSADAVFAAQHGNLACTSLLLPLRRWREHIVARLMYVRSTHARRTRERVAYQVARITFGGLSPAVGMVGLRMAGRANDSDGHGGRALGHDGIRRRQASWRGTCGDRGTSTAHLRARPLSSLFHASATALAAAHGIYLRTA